MNSFSVKELNRIEKVGKLEKNEKNSFEYLENLNLSDLKYAIFTLTNDTRNSFNKVQAINELVKILKNDKIISIFFHRLTLPEKRILNELCYKNQISFLDALEVLVELNEFSTLPIFKLVNIGLSQKIEANSTLPNLNFNFKLKLSPLLNPKIIPIIQLPKSTLTQNEPPFGYCIPLKNALSSFFLAKHNFECSATTVETFYKRIFENLISDSFIKDFSEIVSNSFETIHQNCYKSWVKTFLPIYIPFYNPNDFENWSKLIFKAVKNVFKEKPELFINEISTICEGFLAHFSEAFNLNNNFRSNSNRIPFLTKIITEDFVKLGFVIFNSQTKKFSATQELFGNYEIEESHNFTFVRENIVRFEELKSFQQIISLNLFGDLFIEKTCKLNPKKIIKLIEKGISLSEIQVLLKIIFGKIPRIFQEEITKLSKRKDAVKLSTNLLIYEIENRELWKKIKAKGFRSAKRKFVFVPQEEAKYFEMKFLRDFEIIETNHSKPIEFNENIIKLDKSKSDLRLESILEKLAEKTDKIDEFRLTKNSIAKGKDLGIKIEDVNYLLSKVAFGTISKELKNVILSK